MVLKIGSGGKWKRGVIIAVVVVAVVLLGWLVWQNRWRFLPQAPAVLPQAVVKAEPTITALESKMLVMGDVYWGRYINDWSQASPLKYAYSFSRLSEFNRDAYNAWIADMECPVTNNPKVSSAIEDSTLQFDCSPAYLPEAKKWFTAFTLANNHTDNQGAAGFAETKQHMDENGIQYFGSYDPEDYANLCDVLSIPTTVTMSDSTTKQGKLPMVWCGYHGVFRTPSATSIGVMAKYSGLFTVVAMPHSGAEYKPAPDEIKTTFYRALIDGGADAVLGDHAHWVQSTEAYNGKLIVYSMGNFIFDQQAGNEMTRAAEIGLTASVTANNAPDIDKWLKLGESCSSYADDCLVKASEEHLTKLPLKLHFTVVGSRDNGKITHPATEIELASIKQRMNWTTTAKNLSGLSSAE